MECEINSIKFCDILNSIAFHNKTEDSHFSP